MIDYEDFFPTYLQWLASHADAELEEFFDFVTDLVPLPEDVELPTHSEALLEILDNTQLALLHSAAEMDAGREPTSAGELIDTLHELFEITGTPSHERPTAEQLAQASAQLVQLGLLYNPDASLSTPVDALAELWEPDRLYAVPPQISAAFDPATEQVWRLVDAHRNPLSEQHLRDLFEQHSDKQRSIVRMLVANGGVGHSAAFQPGANPDHPLAQLLAAGIVDRLDDTTVRVTGRLQEILRNTTVGPAGGSWALPQEPMQHTDSQTTNAAVAHTVQLLTEWTDAIHDLGQYPITPLNKGGIGVREVKKIAHRRQMSEAAVQSQLSQLIDLNLLALGTAAPGHEFLFALTEHALDFAEMGLAQQWAHALLSWRVSRYAPWLVDHGEIRVGQSEAFSSHAAALREVFPQLLISAGPSKNDVEQHLWRLQPHLAWETTRQAWDVLWHQAHELGLYRPTDEGIQPTPVAAALVNSTTTDELVTAVEELLPPPVDMLIVQGDHTILAPGPLVPEDTHMLGRFAAKESSGMASVWRMTAETIHAAITQGLSSEDILNFLGAMSPGRSAESLPQSLRYMVHDMARKEAGSASDKEIYRIIPDEPTAPTHVHTMMEYIGSYRDCLDEQGEDIDGLGSNGTAVDPAEITDMLRTAADSGHTLEVTLASSDGSPVARTGTVIAVTPTMFSIISPDGHSTSVQPHRLISARLTAS